MLFMINSPLILICLYILLNGIATFYLFMFYAFQKQFENISLAVNKTSLCQFHTIAQSYYKVAENPSVRQSSISVKLFCLDLYSQKGRKLMRLYQVLLGEIILIGCLLISFLC